MSRYTQFTKRLMAAFSKIAEGAESQSRTNCTCFYIHDRGSPRNETDLMSSGVQWLEIANRQADCSLHSCCMCDFSYHCWGTPEEVPKSGSTLPDIDAEDHRNSCFAMAFPVSPP